MSLFEHIQNIVSKWSEDDCIEFLKGSRETIQELCAEELTNQFGDCTTVEQFERIANKRYLEAPANYGRLKP